MAAICKKLSRATNECDSNRHQWCRNNRTRIHGDARGFFIETYQAERYRQQAHIDLPFVQDNHPGHPGVLRGLHFQKTKPQGKLVRVVRGEVFDVIVDLRRNSQLWPLARRLAIGGQPPSVLAAPGTAHGFVVTSESADFEYKCTDYYDPDDEGCLLWNDPQVNIEWPVENPRLSEKDRAGQSFAELTA